MSDLISRQAAIDALGEEPMVWTDSDYEIAQRNQWNLDKLAIETVPTAEPKKGKWMKVHWKAFRCSECNRISEYFANYCPNCGARMEENE